MLGVALSIVAPKGRKHLCAAALFGLVRTGFATLPDPRPGGAESSLPDALRSAFALVSLKSPALLAVDQERAEGNWATIYGIGRAPCDPQRRAILDPVSPESLRPLFKNVLRQLPRGKALDPMGFLDDSYLLSLDGTGDFSSTTIHCASCLPKVHRTGSVTYQQQRLGAAIVHPDVREVLPLLPEAMVKQEGTDKTIATAMRPPASLPHCERTTRI